MELTIQKNLSAILTCTDKKSTTNFWVLVVDIPLCFSGRDQLRPLPTNHKISPTTNTTSKIPTHTPALKIPPITSHEEKVIAIANAKSPNKEYCFMSSSFW